jgi:hypothetical protein
VCCCGKGVATVFQSRVCFSSENGVWSSEVLLKMLRRKIFREKYQMLKFSSKDAGQDSELHTSHSELIPGFISET